MIKQRYCAKGEIGANRDKAALENGKKQSVRRSKRRIMPALEKLPLPAYNIKH